MNDSISRQAAIEALLEKGQRSKRYRLGDIWELNFDEIREAIATVPSAQPSDYDKQRLVNSIRAGIVATNTKDVYSCGMRNGMRWCKSLLEDEPPTFEDASQYEQPKKIMCRDCKYFQKWRSEEVAKKFGQIYECGNGILRNPVPDDFCSKAERREE